MSEKIAVYTAIMGDYDPIRADQRWGGADWFMFTDQPFNPDTGWTIKPVKRLFIDPRRDARRLKTLSHELFPDYTHVIWIDGSVSLRVTPERLVSDGLGDKDIACLTHPDRICLYQEAEACKALGLDESETIDRQVEKYRKAKYPVNNGLGETRVLIRKNTEETRYFNENWEHEILNNSLRDQISFNYCAWVNFLSISYMIDWKHTTDFIYHNHPK